MDPKRLLEQFLASEAGQQVVGAAQDARSGAAGSGIAGVGGSLAVGGVLGLLMGNKKARKKAKKLAGGALGYGGAAALGALGHRAYANWQASRTSQPAAPTTVAAPPETAFLPSAAPDSTGRPFELALVTAMVAAANADGHIDPDERRAIFEQATALPLDADDKAFVFDALASPPSLADVAAMATSSEQSTELYLASRLAIDPDEPSEQAYLSALASRLGLDPALVTELDQQMDDAAR